MDSKEPKRSESADCCQQTEVPRAWDTGSVLQGESKKPVCTMMGWIKNKNHATSHTWFDNVTADSTTSFGYSVQGVTFPSSWGREPYREVVRLGDS